MSYREMPSLVFNTELGTCGTCSFEDADCESEPCSESEAASWNACRTTVFGEPYSGTSSFSGLYAGWYNGMNGHKESDFPQPLTIRTIFSRSDRGVVISVGGVDHIRETSISSPPSDVLQHFKPWPALIDLEQTYSQLPRSDWQRLFVHAALHLQNADDHFAIQLGLLLSETVVYVCAESTLLVHSLSDILEKLESWLISVQESQDRGDFKFQGSVRKTERVYLLVNRLSQGTLRNLVKAGTATSKYRILKRVVKNPSGACVEVGDVVSGLDSKVAHICFTIMGLCKETAKDAVAQMHNKEVVSYIKNLSKSLFLQRKWSSRQTVVEEAASCISFPFDGSDKISYAFLRKKAGKSDEIFDLFLGSPDRLCNGKQIQRDGFIFESNDHIKNVVKEEDRAKVTVVFTVLLQVKRSEARKVSLLSSGQATAIVVSSVLEDDTATTPHSFCFTIGGRYEIKETQNTSNRITIVLTKE